MNVDRGVRESDGFDHLGLGLRGERAETIKRKRRKEIIDGEWFAVASQMKVD